MLKVGDLVKYHELSGNIVACYGIIISLEALCCPPALPHDEWEVGAIVLDTEGYHLFLQMNEMIKV